ncbi:hypothetical protein GOD62_29780 [Sinorhizobium medicae]|nr:hypothetical protein [Sinorhizobium medicae]MDX0796774.1 hypothetical protein [Sinorhizobium medicae]
MPSRTYADETEVVPLLSQMKLPQWVILEIASQVAGERANVSPLDAPPVVGFETWRWGTRYSREHAELKRLGWRPCEKDQVSGIRNAETGVKLVFCNTNANTGTGKNPKNVHKKGPANCRLIEKNSPQLSFLPTDDPCDDLWYLCCHFCDAYIAIEISRPDSEVGGIITNFSDRIIVARPHEIPGIRRLNVPEEYADVERPKVTRKKRG